MKNRNNNVVLPAEIMSLSHRHPDEDERDNNMDRGCYSLTRKRKECYINVIA